MADARARHWATAGTVLIQGAAGPHSGIVNGAFEVARRPDNQPPLYQRADGRDGWLFVNSRGNWAVGNKTNKDRRKISPGGCAFAVEEAEGRLPHEVGAAWRVRVNGELTGAADNEGQLSECQLQVLHGAEAEASIARVWMIARTHKFTHTSTGSLAFSRRYISPMAA